MPDQPTPAPTGASGSPNSASINAILQDLAKQRAGQAAYPPKAPAKPMSPPPNLPITPPAIPGAAIPRPPVTPPAPREMPVTAAPKPATPPPAPKPVTPPATAPIAPKPAPAQPAQAYSGELRTMKTDISNIQVGQPPTGLKSAPITPVTQVKTAQPAPGQIAVPPPTPSRKSRKILIAVLGLVVLIVLAAIVSSILGGGQPLETTAPSPSPSSPIPTLSRAPAVKNLENYFGQATGTRTEPIPISGSARNINETSAEGATGAHAAGNLLPPALAAVVGPDTAFLVFGQGDPTQLRYILVYELTDAISGRQYVKNWEAGTMSQDLSTIFAYQVSQATTLTFLDGTYKQIALRYRNFPTADKALDWSIVPASNGKNYLILAASREAAFFVLNRLTQ
jgi:hypothetical protein